MKKYFFFLLGSMILICCNGQKNDLSNIIFIEKQKDFLSDFTYTYEKEFIMNDSELYNVYKSSSKKALTFDKLDLSGYLTKEGDYGTNNILFMFSKKDSVLTYYEIHLYKKDVIKKFLETLNTKFNKPEYTYSIDIQDKEPNSMLWENHGILYLITGINQKLITFNSFKIDNKKLLEDQLSGSFQYYADYLEYLEKNNIKKTNLSYYNYAKKMNDDGDEYYLQSFRPL